VNTGRSRFLKSSYELLIREMPCFLYFEENTPSNRNKSIKGIMMALIPPTKAGYFHGENVALGERAPYIPMKPQ